MKSAQRRFSTAGVIISGILLLSMVGNIMAATSGDLPARIDPGVMVLMAFGSAGLPGLLLLIRSFRLPMGFGRGLMTGLGGLFLGMALIKAGLATSNPDPGVVGFALILGGVLTYFGFQKPKRKCPVCAEKVQRDARVCKHCGSALTEPAEDEQARSESAAVADG